MNDERSELNLQAHSFWNHSKHLQFTSCIRNASSLFPPMPTFIIPLLYSHTHVEILISLFGWWLILIVLTTVAQHLGPRLFSTCSCKLDSLSPPLVLSHCSSHPPPNGRARVHSRSSTAGAGQLEIKSIVICECGNLSGLFLLQIHSLSLSPLSHPPFFSVLSSFFLFLFHNVKSIPLKGFSLTNSTMEFSNIHF